jgi:hypothetical protein
MNQTMEIEKINLMDLPNDILILVANHFIEQQKDVQVFVSLACTNSFFYNILNKDELFEKLFYAQTPHTKINDDVSSLSHKEKIRLYNFTGCQYCKNPRTRKIYIEFAVRCCINCLYERTINECYLVNDYHVDEHNKNKIRFREINNYHYKFGAHTAKYFWKKDVENFIKKSKSTVFKIK